jgi:hypothetical protein
MLFSMHSVRKLGLDRKTGFISSLITYSEVVITLDFESSILSSNLSR